MASALPAQLRTERLLLRRWRAEDAPALAPVLVANVAHLGGWIPRWVSEPAALPDLARRLAGFAGAFDADREWRFAILSLDEEAVLGEASLFPRSDAGRVALTAADRVEIGYWLRQDATGKGFATEVTLALLATASALLMLSRAEIRCDARNERSAAVPRRLGFQLAATIDEEADAAGPLPSRELVWTADLPYTAGAAG